MILSKKEVQNIKRAYKQAIAAECRFVATMGNLSSIITESICVAGNVDHLKGDGFGFTPESNSHDHIPIDLLIELAENGEITEDIILQNLSI